MGVSSSMNKEIEFVLPNGLTINLNCAKDVFIPTLTTNFIINAVKSTERSNLRKKFLDLGCGIGVVGIALYKLNIIDKIYASDICAKASQITKKNCNKHQILHDVRVGKDFEPWANEKFDVIIDDISGVSDEVARLSTWFKGVSCESGIDGSNLTNNVIKSSQNFLNKKGSLYFPIISLSNENSILQQARFFFSYIKLISNTCWPMPSELLVHIDHLEKLKKNGNIQYIEKFGIKLCYTKIYKVWN